MNKAIEITEEILQDHVELTKTLTAIPAPSYDEGRRTDFLMDYLKEIGYQPIRGEEGNVYVEENITDDAKDIRLYTAHIDTVFPDITPIEVITDGDYLRAPGVGDDTANVAGMLTILKYRKKLGITPDHPAVYCFDVGEEGLGNLCGMKAAFARYEGRIKEHIAFDGSTDIIVNAAVGSKRYEVTVYTQGGHSYNDYGNLNAITVAADFINQYYQIDTDKFPGKTTINVGLVYGGTSVNTIAQECTFLFEYRSDNQEGISIMNDISEKLLNKIKEKYKEKADVEVQLIGDRPGQGDVDMDKQNALVSHVEELLTAQTGKKPEYESGSTDCNITLSHGIPAVCFGIYLGAGQHTREEYISISSMKDGLAVFSKLMQEDQLYERPATIL